MPPVEIVSAQEVQTAWEWLRQSLPARNNAPGLKFQYDDIANWNHAQTGRLLNPVQDAVQNISLLYRISQFSLINELSDLINNNQYHSVIVQSGILDADSKSVISSAKRFRHGLSEHLAHWVRAAHSVPEAGRKVLTKPNFQPEDKGPDGIYLRISQDVVFVEAFSVKSSEKDPKGLMSTASLRKSGKPGSTKKMLDAFHKMVSENHGFTRLQDKVAEAANCLQFNATTYIKSALLGEVACHGIAVSDHTFGNPALFDGYEHVPISQDRRFATFVGSTSWKAFAESVRKDCIAELRAKGAW